MRSQKRTLNRYEDAFASLAQVSQEFPPPPKKKLPPGPNFLGNFPAAQIFGGGAYFLSHRLEDLTSRLQVINQADPHDFVFINAMQVVSSASRSKSTNIELSTNIKSVAFLDSVRSTTIQE